MFKSNQVQRSNIPGVSSEGFAHQQAICRNLLTQQVGGAPLSTEARPRRRARTVAV